LFALDVENHGGPARRRCDRQCMLGQ
jgi:hypothetical protein